MKQTLSDYLELLDEESQLSQVFNLLRQNKGDDARQIVIDEAINNPDIELDIANSNPANGILDLWGGASQWIKMLAEESFTIRFKHVVPQQCVREGGCLFKVLRPGFWREPQVDSRERTKWQIDVVNSDEVVQEAIEARAELPLDHVMDYHFTETVRPNSCNSGRWPKLPGERNSSDKDDAKHQCPGPTMTAGSEIISWPPFLCFSCGNCVAILPKLWHWREQSFVLRSAVCCNNWHYNAVIPKGLDDEGWLTYDGNRHGKAKFREHRTMEEAREGMVVSIAIYEVYPRDYFYERDDDLIAYQGRMNWNVKLLIEQANRFSDQNLDFPSSESESETQKKESVANKPTVQQVNENLQQLRDEFKVSASMIKSKPTKKNKNKKKPTFTKKRARSKSKTPPIAKRKGVRTTKSTYMRNKK